MSYSSSSSSAGAAAGPDVQVARARDGVEVPEGVDSASVAPSKVGPTGFVNPIVLACWLPMAGAALLILTTFGPSAQGLRLIVRLAARLSFLLFLSVFLASPIGALWPGALSRWLSANRRSLGLGFAAVHFTAGAALVGLHSLHEATFYAITYPLQRIGGTVGFFAILLMVVTSFDGPKRALGLGRWKLVHTACLYFICSNYLVSFGRRAILNGMPFYLPPFILLLAAIAIRVAGALARARARRAASAVPALPTTSLHALEARAAMHGDQAALFSRQDGRYVPTSWREYAARVRRFALGLRALGFGTGDVLAIMSQNREEWVVANLGAMALGGAAVGVYTTSTPEQIRYVLGHSGAKAVLVENASHLAQIQGVRSTLPALERVIVIEPDATCANEASGPVNTGSFLCYAEVLALGQGIDPRSYREELDRIDRRGLATIIYTSGTTGNPKGVMLGHEGLIGTASELTRAMMPRGGRGEIVISYLPLSHVAEQLSSIHGPILNGSQVYFGGSIEQLPEDLRTIRPTGFFSVPRVWEAFRTGLEQRFADLAPRRRALLDWARRITASRYELVLRHRRVPLGLELSYRLARRLVLSGLKRRLGLERAWLYTTSAAPIRRDVLDFFASLDVVIRELYGQSELSGPVTLNTPSDTRLGTLGRPMHGVEVRIGDGGQILVRSPGACLGYYRDPEATASLLADGWVQSGDVGALDADGYLSITGRLSEAITLTDGETIAPAPVEEAVRRVLPVGNVLLVGHARPYLVALLTLDRRRIPAFSEERGLPSDPAELAAHPDLLEYLARCIPHETSQLLPSDRLVRRFLVLPTDFTVEAGELTPTLKLRRKVVEQKYAQSIEGLYSEPRSAETGAKCQSIAERFVTG